ncbi:HD-GYP domain, c-di-GMP phosphodiesterase class II (or its inactivated variant) [Fontibacillus panacisegetis]|uniref:HD-GYP domain, c-di-GMP phosphodiesterase class II (Or its inactivated variant) n=2 Tax=Fontibacillus panacisegetis TaxID=670482 RepID=A0A1G7KFA2_9BACL|nr:HD-GYP domain, c-di-GMP phosphodiesterase class II (or its inactivated variant) [Fontibacillus panacisegetis]
MDLNPGDRLRTDVFNHSGVLILDKEKELTNESIVKLLQHGIDYIDILPQPTVVTEVDNSFTSPMMLSDQVLHVKPSFDKAIDGFELMFLEALSTGSFDNSQVDKVLEPIVNQLVGQKDVISLLLVLNDKDNYTYNHSMQVGMLSYYIATWLGYPKDEAYIIGKAGYLIDIGKSKVPQEILTKPGKLTPEEFEQVKRHTEYGHDIILKSTGDELLALIALQHHEREDGSGYPHGLSEKEIHPYAKITAVADVYTAMTSNRVYQSKQEFLTVLRELNSLSFGKLSAEPTQLLIKHLLPNFIGKKVTLSNGESGSIVMTNQTDFFRPLVQTNSKFIDLSKERDIIISEIFL